MRQRLKRLSGLATIAAAVIASTTLVTLKAKAAPPPPQVTLYEIPSVASTNPQALVRDAKIVGSVITAVGSGRNPANNNVDGALYVIDRVNPVTTTFLPQYVGTGNGTVVAEELTPDGAYIAAGGRNFVNGANFVAASRIGTAGLSLLNLVSSPSLNYNLTAGSSAKTISDDGAVLYTQVTATVQITPTITRARQRVVRIDATTGTSTPIYPIAGPIDTDAQPVSQNMLPHGASADGSVALASWNRTQGSPNVLPPNDQTFRYTNINGVGAVADIPRLPGGTWNRPLGIDSSGELSVLVGNSAEYPNGEIYLHHGSTNALTRLGSPKPVWTVSFNLGGITDDGSVVAATYSKAATGVNTALAYFHNSNGWFQFAAAMAAGGVNLTGVDRFLVGGVSPDATLVWGSLVRNGISVGWVAEFPAGYLKNFSVTPTPPIDTSIVGAWSADGGGNPDPANPGGVIVFMRNGTFFSVDDIGFERGVFSFDGATVSGTTLQDLADDGAFSHDNGRPSSVGVVGDELRAPAGCVFDSNNPGACFVATRITSQPGEIYGAWLFGDASLDDQSALVVLTSSGKYLMLQDGDPVTDPGGYDGVELGTFVWNPANNVFSSVSTLDQNGTWGVSAPGGSQMQATLSGDELALTVVDGTDSFTALRVVDPATVTPTITSALTLGGTATVPLTYTITGTRAISYGVSGAAWLSANATTGVVTGTPPAAGTFNVTIFAENSLGDSGNETLVLAIAPPNTSTGSGVQITPSVPQGGSPIDMTFSNVTSAGQTTVTVVDPDTAPAPPSGFQLGPVYYDIDTTATFTGPVEVCFSYAGSPGSPRLFHFESGAWVDITSSVDPATQTICGLTSSFSPFAVFVSPIVRTGFYSPVSPVAGFVNTVKGGSTVPLKFDVYVNGVKKTDTAGLSFSVSSAGCAGGAEDPVDFVTTGETSLRYDGTQFIQNWKTPKTAGCYIVRMTTAADGLSIAALFRLK